MKKKIFLLNLLIIAIILFVGQYICGENWSYTSYWCGFITFAVAQIVYVTYDEGDIR